MKNIHKYSSKVEIYILLTIIYKFGILGITNISTVH